MNQLGPRRSLLINLNLSFWFAVILISRLKGYSFHIIQQHYILRLLNNQLKTNYIFFFDANHLK